MSNIIHSAEVTARQIGLISFSARGCLLHDQPSLENWIASYIRTRQPEVKEADIRRILLLKLAELNERARAGEEEKSDVQYFLRAVLEKYFENSDPHIELVAAMDAYRASVKVVLPDFVFEVCEKLKERGYKLAVLSNEGPALIEVLKIYRLFDYFDLVSVAEETHLYKPDVRAFSELLDEFDIEASKMIHVGDRYATDVLGAERSGVGRILYDPKNYEMLAINRLEDISQKVVSIESLRKNRALTDVKVITQFKELLDYFK